MLAVAVSHVIGKEDQDVGTGGIGREGGEGRQEGESGGECGMGFHGGLGLSGRLGHAIGIPPPNVTSNKTEVADGVNREILLGGARAAEILRESGIGALEFLGVIRKPLDLGRLGSRVLG